MERGKETKEGMGKKRRRKRRTQRGVLKEDVSVLFLWRPLKFLVRGEIWRVVVIFLGETFWISLTTCLIVSLRLGELCRRCLM